MPVIYVLNSLPIERFDPDEIRAAVTESNFHTLCDQYGLEPALIEPALKYLAVQAAPDPDVSFFSLRYAPETSAPIIVNRWEDVDRLSALLHTLGSAAPSAAYQQIKQTREVLLIEISREQSHDLGLLFAYELARWAAFKGKGVVRGLDGLWYRLNSHKAFIPIKQY